MATVSDKNFDGYTVAYDREEIQFPVYVLAIGSAALLVAAFTSANVVLLALALIGGALAYYNYPLLETGRPRLAANRDGLFIEGLGLLEWRLVERIDLLPVVVRAMTYHELEVSLRQPIPSALIAERSAMPAYRAPMRLPSWLHSNTSIRIPLDIFDRPPEEIHATFLRIWRFNRART